MLKQNKFQILPRARVIVHLEFELKEPRQRPLAEISINNNMTKHNAT